MRVNPIKANPATKRGDDIKSITAYSHYLVMKAQSVGNFHVDGHDISEEEAFVAEQSRSICDRIVRNLPSCKESEIPELMECYDIMCRLGYNRMPDKNLIDRNRMRLFKAWKASDKSIAESRIFGMIAPDALYSPQKMDKEYVETYLSIKERWIATLVGHDYFPDTTSYENYQRLALIMRENIDLELRAVTGSKITAGEMKRRWYEHNRVEDLSTLGTQILRSYRRFAASLFPAVMDFEEKMELDNRILEELIARTDLHPHDREAFRLALQYNRELAED